MNPVALSERGSLSPRREIYLFASLLCYRCKVSGRLLTRMRGGTTVRDSIGKYIYPISPDKGKDRHD